MRAEIARIQQALKVTTLYVTHDQVEAMTMGHRVAVMRDGRLQQVDTPNRLYDSPVNLFVASFVGSPAMNLLEGELVRDGEALACRSGAAELELPPGTETLRPSLAQYVGRQIAFGVRPEDVHPAHEDGIRIHGRTLLVEALGAEQLVHVEVPATPLGRTDLVDATAQQPGPSLALDGGGRAATILARFDRDSSAHAGEPVELAIDPRRLHFFDLETGAAIEAIDVPVAAGLAG
jgi:multiple sugar transport system ATP-binding protein